MNSKIYLSAGHWNGDSGATANGYQENNLTKEFRDLVTYQLKSLFPDVAVINDSDSESLAEYLKRINPNPEDVVVEVHFDSFGNDAKGSTALIADKHTEESKRLAEELVNCTALMLKTDNRGVKTESDSHRGKLGFVRKGGKNVLMEIEFISNKEYLDNYLSMKERLAILWAKILYDYSKI